MITGIINNSVVRLGLVLPSWMLGNKLLLQKIKEIFGVLEIISNTDY
jgi:hypothetical protein